MVILLYFAGLAAFVYCGGMNYVRDTKSGIIFIVVAVIGLYLAAELNQIPGKLRARKQLAHLTGRTEGQVTSHYEDEYEERDEDGDIHRRSRGTVIYYEFEVGGVTYTGSGYGSWALWKRDHQTICYDPDHPEDNLPLNEYNSKTKTHIIGTLLYVIISFAILFGIIMLFASIT